MNWRRFRNYRKVNVTSARVITQFKYGQKTIKSADFEDYMPMFCFSTTKDIKRRIKKLENPKV